MHISRSAILYKMTLIVAAHNDKDIILCADTLTTVDIDGVKQPDIISHKLIKINNHAALGISGLFSASTKQFIDDFCYNNRGEKNVTILKDKLLANAKATLNLGIREKLQLMLVGFENSTPLLKVIEIKWDESQSGTAKDNYFPLGFNGPQTRAKELLAKSDINSKPKLRELKEIVRDTVSTCIREFSDSTDERLGGEPDLIVLYRK